MSSDAIQRATVYGVGANEACEGNDNRLRWWRAGGTFAASGDHAITTTGLTNFQPRVGQAIKLFSSLGVVCEKSSGTYITSVASMLGVTTAHLTTPRKALWFELVATPALHINVYGTELGSLDPVPVLLAHTGTIASSTDYVLTADNASGLSGTIAVTYAAVIVDGSKTVVEYFRHNIISAITPGVVTYRGQACAAPTEVWLGSPDCVRCIDLSIPGNWSSPASQTAYKDKMFETPRWPYGDGTVVYALSKTDSEDTGATKAKAGVTVELVSVTNAIPATTVALTDTFDEFPDAPLRHVKHLDRLSVYTVAGTVGDGKNLTYLAFVVVY